MIGVVCNECGRSLRVTCSRRRHIATDEPHDEIEDQVNNLRGLNKAHICIVTEMTTAALLYLIYLKRCTPHCLCNLGRDNQLDNVVNLSKTFAHFILQTLHYIVSHKVTLSNYIIRIVSYRIEPLIFLCLQPCLVPVHLQRWPYPSEL